MKQHKAIKQSSDILFLDTVTLPPGPVLLYLSLRSWRAWCLRVLGGLCCLVSLRVCIVQCVVPLGVGQVEGRVQSVFFFSNGEGDVYSTGVLERVGRIECTVTAACAKATHAQTVDRRRAEAERSRPSPTEFESAAVPVVTPRGYEPVGFSDDVVLQS